MISPEYLADVVRVLLAERRELLVKLGWTPPPTEDDFWYRDDHGPVHATDVWAFVLEDVDRLTWKPPTLERGSAGHVAPGGVGSG